MEKRSELHKTENLSVLRSAVCVKICVVKKIATICRSCGPAYAVAGEEREFLSRLPALVADILSAEFTGYDGGSLRVACFAVKRNKFVKR